MVRVAIDKDIADHGPAGAVGAEVVGHIHRVGAIEPGRRALGAVVGQRAREREVAERRRRRVLLQAGDAFGAGRGRVAKRDQLRAALDERRPGRTEAVDRRLLGGSPDASTADPMAA